MGKQKDRRNAEYNKGILENSNTELKESSISGESESEWPIAKTESNSNTFTDRNVGAIRQTISISNIDQRIKHSIKKKLTTRKELTYSKWAGKVTGTKKATHKGPWLNKSFAEFTTN